MFGRKSKVVSGSGSSPADTDTSVVADTAYQRVAFPMRYKQLEANHPRKRVVASVRFEVLAYSAGPDQTHRYDNSLSTRCYKFYVIPL